VKSKKKEQKKRKKMENERNQQGEMVDSQTVKKTAKSLKGKKSPVQEQ
jgi:hypothetical protein